jgi:hypothetical protein
MLDKCAKHLILVVAGDALEKLREDIEYKQFSDWYYYPVSLPVSQLHKGDAATAGTSAHSAARRCGVTRPKQPEVAAPLIGQGFRPR